MNLFQGEFVNGILDSWYYETVYVIMHCTSFQGCVYAASTSFCTVLPLNNVFHCSAKGTITYYLFGQLFSNRFFHTTGPRNFHGKPAKVTTSAPLEAFVGARVPSCNSAPFRLFRCAGSAAKSLGVEIQSIHSTNNCYDRLYIHQVE